MKCLACNDNIATGQGLKCRNRSCGKDYHYACLNITTAKYMGNKHDYDNLWCCPECANITIRRNRNDNTPVRSAQTLDETVQSTENKHNEILITNRQAELNESTMTIDDNLENSLLGDTINSSVPLEIPNVRPSASCTLPVTLEQISKLIEEKLQIQTNFLLSEMSSLKTTIHKEIVAAINSVKLEMKDQNDTISREQQKIKIDTDELKAKISKLETQNITLQSQIEYLQSNINKNRGDQCNKDWDSPKKLVLYGLEEYRYESEYELMERVMAVFKEIQNVDLYGFIEQIGWIGRTGNRKPLLIELISKRMTNYILRNNYLFKNTGLGISKYLDGESLEERKKLREILREARGNGKHAVIRDNVLYIAGKEYTPPLSRPRITHEETLEKLYLENITLDKKEKQIETITTSSQNSSKTNTLLENRWREKTSNNGNFR